MIDKQFIQWFYHEVYAEPNHNRNGWMREHADLQKHECRDWWMRQAFKAGYEARQLQEQHEYDDWIDKLEDFENE